MVNEEQHIFIPKHRILNEKEVIDLLKKLDVTKEKLPKIFTTDAGLKNIKIKKGDIVEIERKGHLLMKTKYWRLAVEKEATSAEKNIIEKTEKKEKEEEITEETVEEEATSEITEDVE
ncbi:MAG: hypothetical protein KAQ92_01775 [Candidatus Aenigmarchaeota archaeon]|nr:hypothetical protein [Candidatus Aenigmarchaeota archaeon]